MRGQDASGNVAGIRTRQGDQLAALESSFGAQQLGARERLGQGLGSIAERLGQGVSGLRAGFAQQGAGVVGQEASNIANILRNVGQETGALRYGTGQQIAADERALTDVLAQIQQQTGLNLANMDQQTLNNSINLLTNLGGTQAQLATQLATLLGNIGVGQGTQQAQLAGALGEARASGVTNPWGNAISQLTGAFIGANPGTFSREG